MTVALYGPEDLEVLRAMAKKDETVPEDETPVDAEVVEDQKDHTDAWHGGPIEEGQQVGEGGRIEPARPPEDETPAG